MCLLLPHPKLVLDGVVQSYYEFPVYKPAKIIDDLPKGDSIKIHKVTFVFDPNELDWVLQDFQI